VTANHLDAPLEALAQARAELLASFDGISREAFVGPLPATTGDGPRSVLDLLWHAGQLDDWYRRVIHQAATGRPLVPFQEGTRPDYVHTPGLLRTWLEQTRGALLARVRRLSEAELDAPLSLPDGTPATPRQLLGGLAEADREQAARIQALRAGNSRAVT
jgi:hypothetical protein